MTAKENVEEDFAWVAGFLEGLGSNSLFGFAVGAIVSLLIWRAQTKLTANLELKRERRSLYREFLGQYERAFFHSPKDTPYRDCPELMHLMRLQAEIALIGGHEIGMVAREVTFRVVDCINGTEEDVLCADGKERDALQALLYEVGRFTKLGRVSSIPLSSD